MQAGSGLLLRRYQGIKHELRRRLHIEWSSGTRLPPIKDLARQLGTGLNNTHRAIRELVEEGLLHSRPGIGTYVADISPHAIGIDLPADAWKPLPLRGKRAELVYHTPEGLIDTTLHVLTDELTRRGCHVTSTLVSGGARQLQTSEPDVDALVSINPNFYTRIIPAAGQHLVIITTALEIDAASDRYDVIGLDSEQGGLLAGQRMRAIGCRSACFIGHWIDGGFDQTSSLRLAGFERGFGASLPAIHQLKAQDYITEVGARIASEYLAMGRNRPDGIFCASDELAVGFVHGALGHGLEPGRDYQILGFDGQERGRKLHGGPLSTIDAPMEEMGRLAALMLVDRFVREVKEIRRVTLSCSLFEGRTALRNP